MCEDSYSCVVTIKAILRCFELASGLKINFHKSKLVAFNVERTTSECYAKILNCELMKVPFKYLGLYMGGNPRKCQIWEHVVEKIRVKLNVWKGRHLSMAGRICLIKSVFTSIPLFYLSFYKALESV